MMPVAENSQHQDPIDYKKKYKALKRKLKFLLYEHECFIEELRKAQRKLLRVSRDKSFLLDRLVQYERVDDSSDESDATASSDSETDTTREPGNIPKKKKHPQLGMFGDPTTLLSTMGFPSVAQTQAQGLVPSMIPTSFLGANFAASLPTANPGLPLGVSAAGVPLASMLTSAVVGRSPVLGVGASGVSSGKVDPAPLSTVLQHLAAITTTTGAVPGHVKSSPSASEPPKKKAKSSKKSSKAAPSTAASSSTAAAGTAAAAAAVAAAKLARPTSLPQRIITSSVTLGGHMTREELERHLEFKQSTKPQFMSIEKAPNMLPEDIFSNENSNPDSDFDPSQETGDDSDLVIDMPQD